MNMDRLTREGRKYLELPKDIITRKLIERTIRRAEMGEVKYGKTLSENNIDDFIEHCLGEIDDLYKYLLKIQEDYVLVPKQFASETKTQPLESLPPLKDVSVDENNWTWETKEEGVVCNYHYTPRGNQLKPTVETPKTFDPHKNLGENSCIWKNDKLWSVQTPKPLSECMINIVESNKEKMSTHRLSVDELLGIKRTIAGWIPKWQEEAKKQGINLSEGSVIEEKLKEFRDYLDEYEKEEAEKPSIPEEDDDSLVSITIKDGPTFYLYDSEVKDLVELLSKNRVSDLLWFELAEEGRLKILEKELDIFLSEER